MCWGFKGRGGGGGKQRNADTQRFMAKNANAGKTLIVPNFLLFLFPTRSVEEYIFSHQKNVMCCNPVSLALIFPLLKKEPFNVLQRMLLTLHTSNKLKSLFLKTPASLSANHHFQGGETAVAPLTPASYQTRAQKLWGWFYRLHRNVLPSSPLLIFLI